MTNQTLSELHGLQLGFHLTANGTGFLLDFNWMLTFKALNNLGPTCLWDHLSYYTPKRALHSQDQNLLVVPPPKRYPAVLNHNWGIFHLGSNLVELSEEGHLCPAGFDAIPQGL